MWNRSQIMATTFSWFQNSSLRSPLSTSYTCLLYINYISVSISKQLPLSPADKTSKLGLDHIQRRLIKIHINLLCKCNIFDTFKYSIFGYVWLCLGMFCKSWVLCFTPWLSYLQKPINLSIWMSVCFVQYLPTNVTACDCSKQPICNRDTLLALICPALGGQIDFKNLALRAGQNKGRDNWRPAKIGPVEIFCSK